MSMSTSQHFLALNNKPNIEEKKKTNKGEIHNGIMNPLYPTNYKPAFFVVASAATFFIRSILFMSTRAAGGEVFTDHAVCKKPRIILRREKSQFFLETVC